MMRHLLLLAFTLSLSACAPSEREAAPLALEEPSDSIQSADSVAFAYTRLDYDACETIAEYEESGGVELRCLGFAGIPLYVPEGDLRMDVDVGVPNGAWTPLGPFNSLGATVE